MFIKKFVLYSLSIVMVIILMAGCNSKINNSVAAEDPCEMLSESDLNALFSGPTESHDISENLSASGGGQSYGCQYNLAGEVAEKSETNPFPTPENIHIEYIMAKDTIEAENAYNQAVSLWKSSTMPNRTYKDLDDVGNNAFWSYSNSISQLIVQKDTRVFFITLGYFEGSEEDILNKAKTVGRKVVNF